MEEQLLIQLAQQGDTSALAQLLREYHPYVLKYVLKITFDPGLAEDLAQETMLRCIHRIKLYHPQKSKFSSWLITIATRLHIDHLRRQRRERSWQEQEVHVRQLKFRAAQYDEDWPAVLDALATLSWHARTAIILKHYYGYSLEEIADMMDAPIGTIKSRIHNGITTLRKEMNNRGE